MKTKAMIWGLLGVWILHDAEEWLTFAQFAHENSTVVGDCAPSVRRLEVHQRTAISTMGVMVAALTWHGHRTNGASPAFQSAVAGFGLHGVGHLAMSAVIGGYTPGVATSPTLVIPYAAAAWRALGTKGVRGRTTTTVGRAPAMVAGALAVAHLTGWLAARHIR